MPEPLDPGGLPEAAPVFPLPNVVFFPRTVLPLHIFEPRYREMIARASEGDGCIAMALLRPGWEADYHGNPEYHPIGCLGRMTEVGRTEDGRYHLKLIGVRKVALGDLVGETPYRTARIRPIPETVPDDLSPESHQDLVKLLGVCGVILQEVSEKPFPLVSIREGLPYEAVVNSVCFHVGLTPRLKQELLEENDVRERCRRLTALMERHLERLVLAREADPDRAGEATVN